MTYDQWFRSQHGLAYEGLYLFAEAAWEHQQKRIDELETQLAKNNPLLDEAADAIDKLTAERDALKQQRDELLAFAEEVRRTGDTRLASMAITAIASVKEKA